MSNSEGQKLRVVGDFEIIEKIGQGAMGTVFKARQRSLDRIVALKILPPSIAQDQSFIQRFQREARSTAQLNHPNIVMGIDVGQDPASKLWYFAMEYVDGPSLKTLLKERGTVPENEVMNLACDMAKALICAERINMVHRDIKPDNILMNSRNEAKLADLGLARRTDDDANLTQSGQAVGTPHYMAPEQAKGLENEIDIKTDIYALGATLFHLLTGRTPFDGQTGAVVMTKHLTEKPPLAHRENPQVNELLSRLIQRMMSKERHQRPSPAEVFEKIDAMRTGRATGYKPPVRNNASRRQLPTKQQAPIEGLPTGPRVAFSGRSNLPKTNQGMFVGIGIAATILVVAVLVISSSSGKNQTSNNLKANETIQESATEPVLVANAAPAAQASTVPAAGNVPSGFAFYRAYNLGSDQAVKIGEKNFLPVDGNIEVSGVTKSAHELRARPPASVSELQLLRSFVSGESELRVAIRALSPGSFRLFVYTCAPDQAIDFSLAIDKQIVLNKVHTGPPGSWHRIGPFSCEPNGGVIELITKDKIRLCAIELWAALKQSGEAPSVADASSANREPTPRELFEARQAQQAQQSQFQTIVNTAQWPIKNENLLYWWVDGKGSHENLSLKDNVKLNSGRLTFASGVASDPKAGAMLTRDLKKTSAFTIEAIFSTAHHNQDGPARIVSLSKNTTERNFTLGQIKDEVVLRLRTPKTGKNGSNPQITLCKIPVAKPVHLVVTYAEGCITTYLDGKRINESREVSGTFDGWEEHDLVLGNETGGERPWYGDLYAVAIYNVALTPAQVEQSLCLRTTPDHKSSKAPEIASKAEVPVITVPNETVKKFELTGLRATYRGLSSGDSFVRIENTIQLASKAGTIEGISGAGFQATWEGFIYPQASGEYLFEIKAVNGGRLLLDDVLIYDNLYAKRRDHLARIQLEIGKKYLFRFEFQNSRYDGSASVRWGLTEETLEPVRGNPPEHKDDVILGRLDGWELSFNCPESGNKASFKAPTLNFNWPASPCPGIAATRYSGTFSGLIVPEQGGPHVFELGIDETARLFLNDLLLLEETKTNPKAMSLPVQLEAGQSYLVRIDFIERMYGAECRLKWTTPSGESRYIMAQSPGEPTGKLEPVGFLAQYRETREKKLELTRKELTLQRNWGGASPLGISSDNFIATYTGWIVPDATDLYTFYIDYDDGVRFYLDDVLLGDFYHDGLGKAEFANLPMEEGKAYFVKIEYQERLYSAHLLVEWKGSRQEHKKPLSGYLPHVFNASDSKVGSLELGVLAEIADRSGKKMSRMDGTLSFNWGNGAPASGLDADHFSVNWTGGLKAPAAGTYWLKLEFEGNSAELKINHTSFLKSGKDKEPKQIFFKDDKTPYFIQLNYQAGLYSASCRLLWRADDQAEFSPIPANCLIPHQRYSVPKKLNR